MLDRLRTCNGSVLGDVADHYYRNVIRLRDTDEYCGNFPYLCYAARSSRNLFGVERLDGIDYRKAGLMCLKLFCDSLKSRLAAYKDVALDLESGSAHTNLCRRFLA